MVVVVTMELWPKGIKVDTRTLAVIEIVNDGTGDETYGNYDVTVSHAGTYYGQKEEPFKTCRIEKWPRKASPYRLLSKILRTIGQS